MMGGDCTCKYGGCSSIPCYTGRVFTGYYFFWFIFLVVGLIPIPPITYGAFDFLLLWSSSLLCRFILSETLTPHLTHSLILQSMMYYPDTLKVCQNGCKSGHSCTYSPFEYTQKCPYIYQYRHT